MGELEDLADNPLWWMFHATLWEGEFEQGDEMADKEDGAFQTWLKLWHGFGGALLKGYAILAVVAVVVWLLFR